MTELIIIFEGLLVIAAFFVGRRYEKYKMKGDELNEADRISRIKSDAGKLSDDDIKQLCEEFRRGVL